MIVVYLKNIYFHDLNVVIDLKTDRIRMKYKAFSLYILHVHSNTKRIRITQIELMLISIYKILQSTPVPTVAYNLNMNRANDSDLVVAEHLDYV